MVSIAEIIDEAKISVHFGLFIFAYMKPLFGSVSVDIFPIYLLVIVNNSGVNTNDGVTREIVAVDFSSSPWDFAFDNCDCVAVDPECFLDDRVTLKI